MSFTTIGQSRTRFILAVFLFAFLGFTLLVAVRIASDLTKTTDIRSRAATVTNPYIGIHASGNQLVNAQGQIIHVHGVNVTQMFYGNSGTCNTINLQTIDAIATWNVNWVRLWVSPVDWVNNSSCNNGLGATYRDVVMTIIHQIENDGMIAEPTLPYDNNGGAVVNASMGLSAWGQNFWKSFAPFVSTEPAVAIDLLNEPTGPPTGASGWNCLFNGASTGTCGGSYPYVGYNTAISDIRAAGFTGPIGTPGTQFTRGPDGFQNFAPKNANIFFPYHEYEAYATAATAISNLQVNSAQFPVLLEEFNGSSSWINTILSSVDNGNGIGYAVWQWGNDGSNDGLQVVQPETCGTCFINNGQFYHDYIANKSTLSGSTSPTPTLPITPTPHPTNTPTLTPTPTPLRPNTISLSNFVFTPQTLTISVGTTVTWTNTTSNTNHTSTSDTGLWDSGTIAPGQSFSHTFTIPGTFPYHCTFHASMNMTGTVIVIGNTPTPIPSPTAVPTNTPAPTSTPVPNSTKVNVTLLLHGIGSGGDSANPGSGGNSSPIHPQRSISLELFNSQNVSVGVKPGTVSFNTSTGSFKGSVDLGPSLPTGVYTVKVKTSQFLKALIPGIQSLTSGQTTTLPTVTLVNGDINGDNTINILDFNILMGCYSDTLPPTSCTPQNTLLSDITDDGHTNQFDYNLFLRELTNRGGQ